MAYTEYGVVNLALQRLGIKLITSAEWTAATVPRAEAANAVWEYIRNEVLEAADWRFAKSRTTLSRIPPRVDLNCGDGKHIYVEADKWHEDILDISIEIYTNTSDALSVIEDTTDSQNIIIKLANATATKNTAALIQVALRALTNIDTDVSVALWTVTVNAEWTAAPPTTGVDLDEVDMEAGSDESFDYAYLMPTGFLKVCTNTANDRTVDPTGGYGTRFDSNGMLEVRGIMYAYVIESLPDDRLVLLTDYDDDDDPLELVYIRKVTDVTKWTANFISCVAFRLAAELAFKLTEGDEKFKFNMSRYLGALKMAKGLNQSSDYVKDEVGSTDWEMAGRS